MAVQIPVVPKLPMIVATVAVSLVAAAAAAQPSADAPPPMPVIDPGPPISVYLITMGQGDPYWARFGHNALWIRDRENGRDIAYNWGLFDFEEPGFLRRFLSGNTSYWMAGFDTWQMLEVYRQENRTIDVQELALPAATARELREFAEWNALPENRAYRYDYYRDNCSTRIRDALDRVLAGQIKLATDSVRTEHTYRWHTKRLLAEHAPTYTGVMLVLGQPADRPITQWEEMFIPMMMRDHIRSVRVSDGSGNPTPLVVNEWRLFTASRVAERTSAPNRGPTLALIAVVAGLLIVALAWFGTRPSGPRAARTAATSLAAVWSLLAGVAGLVAAGMWAFTHHVFMYANENVLQLTPLSLALLALLPFTTRSASESRLAHYASLLALTIFGLSAVGFLARLLPTMSQKNGEVIALALPIHAAVAAAVWMLAHRDRWQRIRPPDSQVS